MDTTLRRAAFYFIASRSILFHRVAQHFILSRSDQSNLAVGFNPRKVSHIDPVASAMVE